VVWITGLSGSGKTTLANSLAEIFHKNKFPIVRLDGDELRNVLFGNNSFEKNMSKPERIELAMTYSRLCKYLSDQGLNVVISTVSLFSEVHEWNRQEIHEYFEIFLDIPLEILKKRDPKGIYRDFYAGARNNVVGLDIKVDFPTNPDRIITLTESENNVNLSNELFEIIIEGIENNDN
jgi:adenylylsulfate kinase